MYKLIITTKDRTLLFVEYHEDRTKAYKRYADIIQQFPSNIHGTITLIFYKIPEVSKNKRYSYAEITKKLLE